MCRTKQDYLDLLCQTSKNGGFPALSNTGSCQYKTKSGKKCAVGILFPDSVTIPECLVASELFCYSPELKIYIPEDMTLQELRQIQKIHDKIAVYTGAFNKSWNHDLFIKDLLELDCFKGMQPND